MTVNKYKGAKGTLWKVRYKTPSNKYTDKRGFKNKREAELWEAENVLSVNRGTYVSPALGKTKLGPLIEEFVERRGALAETTMASRESIARKWVTPHWAGWTLESVSPAAVHEWLEKMRKKGASESVVDKAYRVLNGVMKLAIDRRLMVLNPVPVLKKLKKAKKRRSFLNNAQVSKLARTVDPRYRVLIGVLAYTGLRFGEAAALRAEAVHIGRKRIDVRLAVAEVNGRLVEGAPKGGRSRSVPIPEFLIPDLAELVASKRPGELLFTAPEGGQLRITTWRRRVFNPARAALTREDPSFPQVTPHDLRHTAASLAIQSGANVKVLQRVMGHSSAALTLDVYADLYESDLDEVSTKMSLIAMETTDFSWGR